MSKKWIDLDQVFFPVGVSSVYFEGRRVSKQDIQIDRNFREVMSSDYDVNDLPDHINYLPRKKAAQYLKVSESTLVRYHLDGKLKWIQEEIELLYIKERNWMLLKQKGLQ